MWVIMLTKCKVHVCILHASTADATENAKRNVVLAETGVEAAAAGKDGYSEESMALAPNLEAQCVPLAIEL